MTRDADLGSLCSWLDASPTPFHAALSATRRLLAAGWQTVERFADGIPVRGVRTVDGSVLAWRRGAPGSPYRIIGAHTDSPNLRVQPNPETGAAGTAQLGIEIYGGVLLNSWLDRDLGLAGRVVARDGSVHLFHVGDAVARIPQLAIHLDREINDRGLLLDRHAHLTPVWGTSQHAFREWLGSVTGIGDIVAFDAQLFDTHRAALIGRDRSLLVSGRLDNQLSCWAAVEALVSPDATSDHTVIVVLNDHEEVGSDSVTGAGGPLLASLLAAIDHEEGLDPRRAIDRRCDSWCLSADNAHAVHPNYQERHDPRHGPILNAGPALKLNGNQHYATSARGAGHVRALAESRGIPLQTFVTRNNMPCGSTIGPITATNLGIEAIDIGVPQWSMHSARETIGADDPTRLRDLLSAFAAG
ncbi:MAG: M18 family aminopeptidase [Actinomycetota bacterium]